MFHEHDVKNKRDISQSQILANEYGGYTMSKRYDENVIQRGRGQSASERIDQGLRSYMMKVYNYMSIGLGITGFVSFFLSTNIALMSAIWGGPQKYLFMLAPVGLVLFLSFRLQTLSFAAAQMVFWVYSALMGISLSMLFMLYTGTSITKVFFITAATFGSMSLYGYTTGRDLTGMGSFLIMGLWGIVIAGLINIFYQSTMMEFIISCVGVLVFTGLTAYDTQNIKLSYQESDGHETAGKKAIFGALQLYLDFINLFISLLRLFGDRR